MPGTLIPGMNGCRSTVSVRLATQECRDFQLVVFLHHPGLRNRATLVVEVAATRCVEACLRRQRTALLRSGRRCCGHIGGNGVVVATAKRIGDSLEEAHRT